MIIRIISAMVGIPLLLFFIIVGGLPLKIVTLIVSLIGMFELYRAVSGRLKLVHLVGFLLEIIYFIITFVENVYLSSNIFIYIAVLLIMMILVVFHRTNNINDGAITIFGFFYIGVMLSLICRIRDFSTMFAWLPFIFAFASDTGAYFVGSVLGKHKFTPELSPHKSVEGAIGGIITTAVISAIYAVICCKYFFLDIKFIPLFAAAGAVGSVFGQFGDLAASAIKRYTGIKDYGNIMPGHGGVLDRFDSVLFTLPLVYIVMLIMA